MSELTLQNISKTFGSITALNDVSFSVNDNEFFILLGPTGAGKSTTLRVICGLEKPDSGHILLDGQICDDFSPSDRDVAIVFQQYSLYPTMTVYDNMAFPLRAPGRKVPEAQIRQQIEAAAEKLRITHLLKRKTVQLSGGEMQRVSIGRAIVRRPRVFLMDEPLSNLDAKLREALRAELKHLQKVEGVTTLYVTHDQIEALTMADRIGVLKQGKLVQVGTPEDIYDRPSNTYVAKLVGTPRINLLTAESENGKIHITDLGITLDLSDKIQLPQHLTIGIRPEDVQLNPAGTLKGEVGLTEPLGAESVIHIKVGTGEIVCVVAGLVQLKNGDLINFDIHQGHLHFFNDQGDRIL
jgi:multiple sugar transport system ATP-binding protein